MSHVRTQIRDAVAGALGALGSVHTSRVYPLAQADLPALVVYMGDEEIEGDLVSLDRRLQVVVEIVVQSDALDDDLDTLIAGAETAVTGTLSGLVVSIAPATITITSSGEGSAPVGRGRLVFQALYRTSYTDPETSI